MYVILIYFKKIYNITSNRPVKFGCKPKCVLGHLAKTESDIPQTVPEVSRGKTQKVSPKTVPGQFAKTFYSKNGSFLIFPIFCRMKVHTVI